MMDGSKIWTSPSIVSALTFELNWIIMLTIMYVHHSQYRGVVSKSVVTSF